MGIQYFFFFLFLWLNNAVSFCERELTRMIPRHLVRHAPRPSNLNCPIDRSVGGTDVVKTPHDSREFPQKSGYCTSRAPACPRVHVCACVCACEWYILCKLNFSYDRFALIYQIIHFNWISLIFFLPGRRRNAPNYFYLEIEINKFVKKKKKIEWATRELNQVLAGSAVAHLCVSRE